MLVDRRHNVMTLTRMNARCFNQVLYEPDTNAITKTSSHEQKLREETMWYLELPEELRHYVPDIFSYSLQKPVNVTLAYIPSPTLASLFVEEKLNPDRWDRVFAGITGLLVDFSRFPGELRRTCLADMYIRKTFQRVSAFLARNEKARTFFKRGYYWLNGRLTLCPIKIFNEHRADFLQLLDGPKACIIHGDLCFSNMLYDPESETIKLVDPRGRFGKRGLYGDQRYDLAKIRHSLSGYEHLVRNLYSLKVTEKGLDLHIGLTEEQGRLRDQWDGLIRSLGYEQPVIKKIEALLFLSMLPLHRESEERQLALYALGTRLMYEAFDHERGGAEG